MQGRISLLAYIFVLVVGTTFAAAQVKPENFVGQWHGERLGSPSVTLNLTLEKGGLAGTGVFYILDRTAENKPKILGEAKVQLLDVKLSGNVISFKVRNQEGEIVMNQGSGDQLT